MFSQVMCIRIGAGLSCTAANLLVFLTPLRVAEAQHVEFVSIPAKILFICQQSFTMPHQKLLIVCVQAGICNYLHTALLSQPIEKARGNNCLLAGHRTWWSVAEMPVHPFHTPVC